MQSKDAEDAIKQTGWRATEIMKCSAALVAGFAEKRLKEGNGAVDGFDFADIIEQGLLGEFGFLGDVRPDQRVVEIGDHMDASVCAAIDQKTVIRWCFVTLSVTIFVGFDDQGKGQDPGSCWDRCGVIGTPEWTIAGGRSACGVLCGLLRRATGGELALEAKVSFGVCVCGEALGAKRQRHTSVRSTFAGKAANHSHEATQSRWLGISPDPSAFSHGSPLNLPCSICAQDAWGGLDLDGVFFGSMCGVELRETCEEKKDRKSKVFWCKGKEQACCWVRGGLHLFSVCVASSLTARGRVNVDLSLPRRRMERKNRIEIASKKISAFGLSA